METFFYLELKKNDLIFDLSWPRLASLPVVSLSLVYNGHHLALAVAQARTSTTTSLTFLRWTNNKLERVTDRSALIRGFLHIELCFVLVCIKTPLDRP